MAGLDRRDLEIISFFSVVFLILASSNLGLLRTPSTYLQIMGPRDILLTFEQNKTIGSIYLLVGSNFGIGVKAYEEGNLTEISNSRFEKGDYNWQKMDVNFKTDSLRLSFESLNLKIYEIAIMDPSGERLNVLNARLEGLGSPEVQKLFDEQEFYDLPPTFISQMYFDEIYFVGAAKDYLSLREPTEWTHPPLGKLIIALGIALFSYSPFGWRIIGVVFAALMIPVIYILSKRVFKSTLAATLSVMLLSFDFLHFSMARIGTVDTYLVFLSLVSVLFFYLSYESLTTTGKPIYKSIFLGIVFFSLAFAVKWTAVFGFLGQIALMVIVGLKRLRRSDGFASVMRSIAKPVVMILISLLIGGFVYISTFIPYMLIGHSLGDVYQAQLNIYGFHTGLTAGHPFASAWWMWPFIIKPLWMFYAQLNEGMVSTIVAMGNPAVWWLGLPSIFLALWRGLKKWNHKYLFVSVLFLFQWLPHALISRALFIYHYYPAVPIMILASSGILAEYWNNPKERRFILMYLISVIAIFVLFYPVISGYPTPIWYRESLKWFRSWVF